MNWLTLVPAYSRDYLTAEAVLVDWKGDKDFVIRDVSCRDNGRYVNKGDAESQEGLKGTTFKIRYSGRANFVLIRFDQEWKIVGVSDGSEMSTEI